MAGSEQKELQPSEKGTNSSKDREKAKVAQGFEKMRNNEPASVGQFEKKDKATLKNNMAKIFARVPPPPPPRK